MKTHNPHIPSDPLHHPGFADIVAQLKTLPRQEIPNGFSNRVMEQIHVRKPPMPVMGRACLKWAAALAVLGSIWMWTLPRTSIPYAQTNLPEAARRLLASQRDDGSWGASPREQTRYDLSITSFALLALIQSTDAPMDNPLTAGHIRAGMKNLIAHQQPDGRFSTDSSSIHFTQYLAGTVLQLAADLPNAEPAWRQAAQKAQPHLPPATQVAGLNNLLAHPDDLPERWKEAGGPALLSAIELLRPPRAMN